MQTAPVDEVIEVVETVGMVGMDEIRAADEAGVVKMSKAEVQGQTVIVDISSKPLARSADSSYVNYSNMK